MVRIQISKGARLRLTAQGHAGAAPKGTDLVCAAVSTLLCTLAAQLRQADDAAYTQLAAGYAELQAAQSEKTAAAFSFAETGLRMLAGEYPKHIRVLDK